MKKRFLLFGLIFALSAVVSHAQIYDVYSQDFETGSDTSYTTTGTGPAVQTTFVSGGSRSMKITHTQSETSIITLDTIDLSFNAQFHYVTLEFMHVAWVDPLNTPVRMECCLIEARRPDQSQWITLNDSHYDMTDGGSVEFQSSSSFSKEAYNDWRAQYGQSPALPTNAMWKRERFNIQQLILDAGVTDRKLIIRFVLKQRNVATGTDGWYIDDIHVRASSQSMTAPKIMMRSFPDHIDYPSSRGAKIAADVTTTVVQGINSDSVYINYRVGNNPTVHTSPMVRQGRTSRFIGRIPMYGYDTLILYHVIAKDSTNNNNTVYFPK
ncbi:MAG: hypothetical protein J5808_04545, partial [Paludibacteraceae bacterium]|nr:hypothetical protein [Paludibacteraceae bacterium]